MFVPGKVDDNHSTLNTFLTKSLGNNTFCQKLSKQD